MLEILWAATALVPMFVLFSARQAVAGWSFGEALLVSGWFALLQGILEGAINPSLSSVVEHIRTGTLDFVLLKPADAQFLVSTARFQPWRATNVLTSAVIFGYAFHLLGRFPSPTGLLAAALLLVTATILLYSLWILTVSAAFYVVKVDNLTFLFSSIFDAARWPSTIFRGILSFVFTFVIPLALMTTYPALAMLGKLRGQTLVLANPQVTLTSKQPSGESVTYAVPEDGKRLLVFITPTIIDPAGNPIHIPGEEPFPADKTPPQQSP